MGRFTELKEWIMGSSSNWNLWYTFYVGTTYDLSSPRTLPNPKVSSLRLIYYCFDIRLLDHVIVGVLLQNIPMWQCWRFGMMDSKTIHPRSSPVNSRSEFVMYPFLFFSDTKRLRTSDGNSIDHTIGVKWCVPLVHTPPAPSAEMSVNCIYLGSPSASLYMLFCCW